jgi:hypothetical protein
VIDEVDWEVDVVVLLGEALVENAEEHVGGVSDDSWEI